MNRIRTQQPVKAIALSGFGAEEDVAKSLEAGFAAHVTKPVDFNQLNNEIERVMG